MTDVLMELMDHLKIRITFGSLLSLLCPNSSNLDHPRLLNIHSLWPHRVLPTLSLIGEELWPTMC